MKILKIVCIVLLLVLVTCCVLFYNDNVHLYLPHVKVHHSEQQISLQYTRAKDHNTEQQQPLSQDTVKIVQHLVDISNYANKLRNYVPTLSPSQTEQVVKWLGFTNLTSKMAQEKFLGCAAIGMFRQLKGKQLKSSSIHIPQSHQHCKKMSFKSTGPIVALSGFPGSGNSWVRQLLESATGVYTGAAYCDTTYTAAGMLGEYVNTENVLAIKAHYRPHMDKSCLHNDKAVYIVRSPFRVILSENNRNLTGSHTREVNYNYVNNPSWVSYVKQKSHKWKIEVMEWLSYKEFPILFVGYENLKNNTYIELKRMLDFIGYPYSEKDILCAVRSSTGTFHRVHKKKNTQPYSPELQELVLSQIKEVDAGLLQHNISIYHPYHED